MPRVLITGNGFDLHHQLPTTYPDFIRITKYLNDSNDYSFESIFNNLDSYEIFKASIRNDIIFNLDNVEQMKIIAKENILFKFFLSEFEIESWIDFENKIEYFLSNVFYGVKLFREKVISKGPLKSDLSYTLSHVNYQIVYIEAFRVLNVIEFDNSDEFIFNKDFLIKKYNHFIDINEEKIIGLIFSELMEFKKLFNLYLQTFVVPLYDKYVNDNILTNIFDNVDYYFTFNYTPTFEKLYKKPRIKTNYLHGKSESNTENIVFGIDDLFNDGCLKNIYMKFTKYFQKFNNRTDFYFLNNISRDKSENYVFYFWGHSLDKSDSSYINEVFDFIDNVNCDIRRIVVIYHSEKSRTNLISNLLNIRTKIDIETKIRNNILVFFKYDSTELVSDLQQNIIKPPLRIFF